MDLKELRGLMEAYSKVYAPIEELYKGKHGQSEKEYQDDRSHGGKMISGDSKHSGAAWSHRSYKGVGEPAKPGERQKHQGKMDKGTRSDLEYRKAKLKKEEVEQIDEVSYSAKAARAGKDIGKPGKAFAKIAASAGKRYGSKERGEKVAGAVLSKLRSEEVDVFDLVLEFLQTEGYAENEENALAIMANLSEEEILEYRKLAAGLVGGMMALNMMKPGMPAPKIKTPTPEREKIELPSRRSAEDSRRMADKLKAEYDADQAKKDSSKKRDRSVRDDFYRSRGVDTSVFDNR